MPATSGTSPPPPPPHGPASRGGLGRTLALLLLTALAHWNALHGEFLYDDLPYVADNPQVQQPTFERIFLEPLTGRAELGLYRPLPVLSYALQAGGRGHDAPTWPFHALNVALHAGVTLLVERLARRLGAGALAAWLCAALFAVHPCHGEAVDWIVGRAELLAALFGTGYLLCELGPPGCRARLAGTALLLAAGLSKESAFVLPGVAIVLDAARAGATRPREWLRLALQRWPGALAVAALLAARVAVMGSVAPALGLAPYRDLALPARLGVAAQLLGEYFARSLLPLTPRMFFHESEFAEPRALALAGLAAWAGALWLVRRDAALRAALLAFPVALGTVLNVRPIQETFAERFLYLPSAFALLLPASLLARLVARERAVRGRIGASLAAPAAALLLLGGFSLRHHPRFDDALSLWRHNVAVAPELPFVRYQFAWFLHDHGIFLRRDAQTPGAVDEYEAALAANERVVARGYRGMPPDQRIRAHLSLGTIWISQVAPARRNPRRARTALEQAIGVGERFEGLDLELGRAYFWFAQLRRFDVGVDAALAGRALRRARELHVPPELRARIEEELAALEAEAGGG